MKAAIMLDHVDQGGLDGKAKKVFIVETHGDKIVSGGSHRILYNDPGYLVIWLKGKNVRTIFMEDRTGEETRLLERAGFRVADLECLQSNIVLRALISE